MPAHFIPIINELQNCPSGRDVEISTQPSDSKQFLSLFIPASDLPHGVESLPKGQWEASSSLAMTYIEQMRYVILPQATRIAIAPTVGFSVQVVKGTALASIIGFVELTKAGTMLNNATFRPFLVYSMVALIYFCLCYPLSWYAKRLEKRWEGLHAGSH